MTHFQVPGDRALQTPGSELPKPWPATPDGYRLFMSGSGGWERIGVQLGQTIELEIVEGKGYTLLTDEGRRVRVMASATDANFAKGYAVGVPELITISVGDVTADRQKFTVKAERPGSTKLQAFDLSSNASKAMLEIVVGKFENHPDMTVDLIADVCRGSDSLKIHALQRMLNNITFLGNDSRGYNVFNNGDNVFEQHADPNISSNAQLGGMTCGFVARIRTDQVFAKDVVPGKLDWYVVGSIHEPLSGQPRKRTDVKYRSTKVEFLRAHILKSLKDGAAVRVGVVDSPTSMYPEQGGKLVAYRAGGHTLVIVGCNANGTEFLYIDPWGGGSKMVYGGGIAGAKFPEPCFQIGKLIVAHDDDRRVQAKDVGNNIIRQHPDTQSTFSYGGGNYLEVVSGPFVVP